MLRFVSLSLILLTTSVALTDELKTLAGKSVTGTVTKVNVGEIVMKTDAGEVTTPLPQVLGLELLAPGTGGLVNSIDLRLIDDTVLHCKSVTIRGKDVEATLSTDLVLRIPTASVVQLQRDANNKELKRKWDDVAKAGIKRDRLVVLRDGELNAIEGILGEADAEGKTIQFKREGADAAVPVLLERVHGLVYWRPDPPTETPVCKVIDRDGNMLQAVKVGYEGKDWTVTTSFGAKIAVKAGTVAKLDFNFGRLTYLSDLDPAKVVEKSGIGLVVRYKKDQNLDGEPLQLDKIYAKGLAMHAHTELEYSLAGKYKDLKGVLGVDTRIGADSQALVTIYCDGEKRFSKVITAKESQAVAVNVKDVQTLKIVVASRNFLDLHDHVTFADARVSQ